MSLKPSLNFITVTLKLMEAVLNRPQVGRTECVFIELRYNTKSVWQSRKFILKKIIMLKQEPA